MPRLKDETITLDSFKGDEVVERCLNTSATMELAIAKWRGKFNLTRDEFFQTAILDLIEDATNVELDEPVKDRSAWYAVSTSTPATWSIKYAEQLTPVRKDYTIHRNASRKAIPIKDSHQPDIGSFNRGMCTSSVLFNVPTTLWHEFSRLCNHFQLVQQDGLLQAVERFISKLMSRSVPISQNSELFRSYTAREQRLRDSVERGTKVRRDKNQAAHNQDELEYEEVVVDV